MAENYLNIISNWDTFAQRGRKRAQDEQRMELNAAKLESNTRILNEQNELAVNKEIADTHAQSQAYAKLYRPKDEKAMKVVESEARQKLQNQLNMYGDDINAFWRAGGRQMLNDYRDAVLNSDEAQIIRNNHKSLFKYLDQAKTDPTLLSDRDVENHRLWENGKNSFTYAGAYSEVEPPSKEEINAAGTLAEAYLHKNETAILTNYLIDTGIEFGADGRKEGDYYQDLLIYQNNKLTPADIERAKDLKINVTSNSRSYAANLQGVFDSMNKNFQGDFNNFWFDPANNKALKNLEGIAWVSPYDYEEGGRNKRVYGQTILHGSEIKIAQKFFPNMKNGKISFEDVMAHQNIMGPTNVFGEDGQFISSGEYDKNDKGFWNPADDWKVNNLQMMFEVVGDDGEPKLLSKEDLVNPEMRDKKKNAVMCLVLSERDRYQLGLNPDDYRYVKLNLNNPGVSKEIDSVMGDIRLNAKDSVRQEGPSYTFIEGETFKWIPQNVNGLVPSLDPQVSKVFKQHNHDEYDLSANSLLMATAMMNNEKENPYLVLQEFANSQNKEELKLINALKNSNYGEYYNLLRDFGASEKEIKELKKNKERIERAYMLYGDRVEQTEEE